MAVTENITVCLSLANTVFASIAFVIWYVQPGQEDHKKADESKVVIIDGDNVEDMYEQCNGDATKDKVHIDTDSNDEKHLYVSEQTRLMDGLKSSNDY